ncbi:LytR C-terminal domain-containing protein [Calditrichota bacterium]
MHRRRRTPTRNIQRKTSSDNTVIFNSSGNKKSLAKRFFFSFLVIIVLAAFSYYFYFQTKIEHEPAVLENIDTVAEKVEAAEKEIIPEPEFKPPQKMIQIEVLNGCGEKGVAKIFESYLRQQGFDVVNTDNYKIGGKISWNVEFTNVIDQIGNVDYAKAVAQSLGIDNQYVSSVDNPSPIYDVTVVIGKDFSQVKGFQEFSK